MKFALPTILFIIVLPTFLFSQNCTLEDAAGCVCETDSDTCYLLPNMNLSRDLLLDTLLRVELSNTLRISVSTPNTGYGPLSIVSTNNIICGKDTIFDAPILVCPDGSEPRQLVRQRIYKKSGDEMSYEDRDAGYMAYHPEHGHLHFNNWNFFSLRIEIPGEPDPLKWPIVGERVKIGFCLRDTHSCEFFEGYCRDENGNILLGNMPNYGLGSGEYMGCSDTNQGISVGAMDIYYYSIPGMLVPLPDGTCNGKYKLIVEVDPYNQIIESNENDNIEVVDVTLTKQTPPDEFTGSVYVSGIGQSIPCNGEGVYLSVPSIGSSYLWSNGDTTNITNITEEGVYDCVIETPCGKAVSNEVLVTADVCNTDCIDTRLSVWLEGTYIEDADEMTTKLNTERRLLPGQRPLDSQITPTPPGQPYSVEPWNYNGIEGLGWSEDAYDTDVVDWVLVSLRDSISKDTELLQTAALLLENGKIEFVEACALPTESSPDSVYIVIEHRNHVGVMTPSPVAITNKRLKYDFRNKNSYQGSAGSGSGQKRLNDTTWVMFAGDGNQSDVPSFDINGWDKGTWENDNGRFNIYMPADYNLDGDISGFDKIFWDFNNGITSRVPK